MQNVKIANLVIVVGIVVGIVVRVIHNHKRLENFPKTIRKKSPMRKTIKMIKQEVKEIKKQKEK